MEGNIPNEQEINKKFNEQFGDFGAQRNLPNAKGALVLGIISTFFGLIWFYWIGSLVGVVCGIIAVVLGKRSKRLYLENQAGYKLTSYNNARAGKILGIIGLILGSLALAALIVGLIIIAADPYSFKF